MRTYRLLLLPALLALFAALHPVHAQTGATGLSVLKNGVGARGIALGETGAADARLGFASFYNPALLGAQDRAALSIAHEISVQDVTSQYVGLVLPLGGWTLGAAMHLASVDNIETRLQPGEAQGDFSSRDFMLGLSAGFPVADNVTAGLSAKFLYEKLYVDDASGYAFDLGLRVRPFGAGALRDVSLGAAVLNMGDMSAMRVESTTLPTMLRAGTAYETTGGLDKMNFGVAVDAVSVFKEKSTNLHAGFEFEYDKLVALRVGYMTGSEIKGMSGGFGVVYGPLNLDYSFVPYTETFGTAHTFALSLSL
ncbi:MAG: PorV/PorQ family protein [Ignavibacteriae bacterium]|nr:PorV/PorQ family protein [Ignavibacteriota bacterium]